MCRVTQSGKHRPKMNSLSLSYHYNLQKYYCTYIYMLNVSKFYIHNCNFIFKFCKFVEFLKQVFVFLCKIFRIFPLSYFPIFYKGSCWWFVFEPFCNPFFFHLCVIYNSCDVEKIILQNFSLEVCAVGKGLIHKFNEKYYSYVLGNKR